MPELSRTRLEDDDDGERVLYTPARLAAAAGVVVCLAAATALLEAALLSTVIVGVVGIGFLIVTGLSSAFVREPAALRDHLLVAAAAVAYPALTLAILYGACGIGLPFAAPGCSLALAQRVVLLNFLFAITGILGGWLVYRLIAMRDRTGLLAIRYGHPQHGWDERQARELVVAREQLDRLTLRRMAEAGADFRKPHAIEHHFIAHGRQAVDALLADRTAAGYALSEIVACDDDGRPSWCFDLVKTMVPERRQVLAESLRMAFLAEKYSITYDGWGCNIER
jgi:regulator of RNase E activity RraB